MISRLQERENWRAFWAEIELLIDLAGQEGARSP